MLHDVKEYIDRKTRMGKIDSFLLYLASSAGFLFSLIGFFSNDVKDIAHLVPLLIPGLILPIYFGYYRGALRDSLEDRTRGWLFLAVGAPFYALLYIGFALRGWIEPHVQESFASGVSTLLMAAGGFLVGRFVGKGSRRLADFLFRSYGKRISHATEKMASDTCSSAIFLAVPLSIIPILLHAPPSNPSSLFAYVLLLAIFLAIAFLFARSSHNWSILSRYSACIRVKQQDAPPRYTFFRRMWLTSMLLMIASFIVIAFLETPLRGLPLVVGIAIISGISSLWAFSSFMSERYAPETALEISNDIEIPQQIRSLLERTIERCS